MTEKQERILEAALELFAKEGYRSTSTNKIAAQAGVSEGLIFRHYTNKEGLLDAIVKQGEERIKLLFADIVLETEPKEVIKKTLEIGLGMTRDNTSADFWKLQYKIKWELECYGEHKMEPLLRALAVAFEKLGYDKPEMEAKQLLITLDGLATRFFLVKDFDFQSIVDFMKTKYEL